jgi:hypothetical protein
MKEILKVCLILAATGQFCVAVLNLSLVRIMGWKEDLARVSLLVRQVFHIHVMFISLTLVIFAAVTLAFANEMSMGAGLIYRWVACSIGTFWAVRTVLQVTYYSSSHWRGIPSRTAVHFILLIVYAAFAVVYFAAAFMR